MKHEMLSAKTRCDIHNFLTQRCEYGLSKYKQQLMTNDGRDDVIDAMQEMADLIQYA